MWEQLVSIIVILVETFQVGSGPSWVQIGSISCLHASNMLAAEHHLYTLWCHTEQVGHTVSSHHDVAFPECHCTHVGIVCKHDVCLTQVAFTQHKPVMAAVAMLHGQCQGRASPVLPPQQMCLMTHLYESH